MAVARPSKFVLDTNCFVDASRVDAEAAALAEFSAWAAPGLYLSTVVAAELRAGAGSAGNRRTLERQILSPYIRRGRLVNPRRRPGKHRERYYRDRLNDVGKEQAVAHIQRWVVERIPAC